ncbi:type II toxin-antitoxin system RelE/ParE family toxin [Longimicrobium terrae]|uniref:Plasmid stabilization system protein ParE n=1 Tax=Longimicrobium terrae TaxID=1639882 RepID=A0A841H0J8_9BACT|nr:type II toxin-antitoxin system RelE/ParE family toxin [Longimicrobium terrae]MBB4637148.1 plasmid stabilization system protein ParE [Longimicrobium terrae]MBB6071591.1 plasmid stabilization system protein ParE [Longimicrobium terrae]NNC29990.1 type II toxin-antitoxin system RelE/ParE family toxin [Longimicrobium terrae]
MRIRIHLEAEADLLDAYDGLRDKGVAEAFQAEIARAFDLLLEFPRLGRAYGSVRSVLIRLFRYRVIYRVEGDEIVILAVAHQSRDEAFWYKRL